MRKPIWKNRHFLRSISIGLTKPLDYSWPWAILQSGCILIALYWFQAPQSSAMIVVVIGVASAFMAIRAEGKWGTTERIIWFTFIALLSVAAIRSIYQEDSQHKREAISLQNETNAHWQSVMQKNQQEFAATMHQFSTTETRLAGISENITGGNSFAYVSPQNYGDVFPGVVWNHGDQALLGVTITIAHTSDPNWASAFYQPIFIGNIGPHEHLPIPNYIFAPKADEKNGQDNYWIMLSAQNGTVSQSLYFRRDKKNPRLWATATQVSKPKTVIGPGSNAKSTTMTLLMWHSWSDEPQLKDAIP